MPGHSDSPSTASNGTKHEEKLISVVDDDEEIGFLLVQTIHSETPYRAHHHTHGAHVLEAIQRFAPDLFVIDYRLPDMTGIELHDQLHNFEHIKRSPTILVSAQKPPMKELRKRNITFIPKPFEIDDLLQTIHRLLA